MRDFGFLGSIFIHSNVVGDGKLHAMGHHHDECFGKVLPSMRTVSSFMDQFVTKQSTIAPMSVLDLAAMD